MAPESWIYRPEPDHAHGTMKHCGTTLAEAQRPLFTLDRTTSTVKNSLGPRCPPSSSLEYTNAFFQRGLEVVPRFLPLQHGQSAAPVDTCKYGKWDCSTSLCGNLGEKQYQERLCDRATTCKLRFLTNHLNEEDYIRIYINT